MPRSAIRLLKALDYLTLDAAAAYGGCHPAVIEDLLRCHALEAFVYFDYYHADLSDYPDDPNTPTPEALSISGWDAGEIIDGWALGRGPKEVNYKWRRPEADGGDLFGAATRGDGDWLRQHLRVRRTDIETIQKGGEPPPSPWSPRELSVLELPSLGIRQGRQQDRDRHYERTRALAEFLWSKDPTLTIAQVIRREEVKKIANEGWGYGQKTLRDWITDLAPSNAPGRREKKG